MAPNEPDLDGERPIEPVAQIARQRTFVEDTEARAVVDAVLRGDRDAFRLLVERESTAVVRACHRVLGDVRDAEDAAQESFVTAYRSLASWRGEGSFGAWMARIAVRVALRQANRRRPVTWLDPVSAETTGSGGDARPSADRASWSALTAGAFASASGLDPASVAVRGEREVAVRTAVAALDEPYREVVALRFFGDLSLAEIAAVSGRPLGTVKTHLHRGLGRLRDSLAAEAVR
jgi:RNA polymerase sigma-70 factor (ECF subfamily)